MTKLLYQTDSSLKHFKAVVEAVDEAGCSVLLDQTIFYPGGGGQPKDEGVLRLGDRIWEVVKLRRSEAGLWHDLTGEGGLPAAGETVEGEINWERRFQLMRTHSAMHILCGVVFRDYGALVTGGDMEPLKGRMDFEFETLSKELVGVIEEAVNREVQKNLPVRTTILSREEAFSIPDLIRTKINLLPPQIQEVRVVELVGLDLQADGGTHVRSTGEVGRIRVVDYKSKGRINKRIYVELEEEK
ncbi:MAG: alanyl-tRNA editing protein [Anaerolineaceae bacterium]|nr:alanyl-tRNA editing protein [Anaerolineaceae bacterium]